MYFVIDKQDSGKTILTFLKAKLKISSYALSSLKKDEKGILVNSKHATVRYILQENDILSINEKDSFDKVNPLIESTPIPLNIVYEDDEIIIVDKPAHMPTHPSHGHTNDTLANAISYVYDLRNEPLVFRPIGRLDMNTSGISMLAKNGISASFLSNVKSQGKIQKKYIALLNGKIDGDGSMQKLETHMKRMDDSVILRCVCDENDEGAFSAITHWRLLYSNNEISLVEAIPQTGRTHQLRVHFASIGHHILGDDIYGSSSAAIDRHALHAWSLSISKPYSGEITTFTSYPPKDMQDAFYNITGKDLIKVLNDNHIHSNNL